MPANDLRSRARAATTAAVQPDMLPDPTDPTERSTVEAADPAAEPLQDIEYTGDIVDAEQVPVHLAWARVMADVQSIGKGDFRKPDAGSGQGYNFRGVDRVVNAVGPALRRHGVLVLPAGIVSIEHRETRTSRGTVMQDCVVQVRWAVIGPMGDQLPIALESAGQANDTADKATAKAISVAQRVLFLTSLHVPTRDPTIDQGHDRGERPTATPKEYRDEIIDPRTSLDRLRTIRGELFRLGVAGAVTANELGDDEALVPMIDRIAALRRAPAVAERAQQPDSGPRPPNRSAPETPPPSADDDGWPEPTRPADAS